MLGEYWAIFVLNSELQTFCKIIPVTLFDHMKKCWYFIQDNAVKLYIMIVMIHL